MLLITLSAFSIARLRNSRQFAFSPVSLIYINITRNCVKTRFTFERSTRRISVVKLLYRSPSIDTLDGVDWNRSVLKMLHVSVLISSSQFLVFFGTILRNRGEWPDINSIWYDPQYIFLFPPRNTMARERVYKNVSG